MKSEMIKMLFVFGTRPEAIKMAPVIKACERYPDRFDTRICVTAQHREMLDQVLGFFDIRPHYDLDIMKKKQSLPDLTAQTLVGVTGMMEREAPDVVCVQGDTTTTFVAAQAAFYLKVPIAHIEAGLRTNNKYSPFPEEINRRLTSVMSDFHFAPTDGAKENLLAEGFEGSSIFVTGNTVIDALEWALIKQNSTGLHEKWRAWFLSEHGVSLTNHVKTILVTGHRRESFGEGFQRICQALQIVARDNHDVRIVYPVHLNPHVQEPVYSLLGNMENIHLIPPLDYEPFIFLMSQSHIILTDSGGIQEEAPTLGVPVLVMRDTSERPEGIAAGSARLVGTNVETIVTETRRLLTDRDAYQRMANVVNPYGDGKAGERIVNILSQQMRR